MRLRNYRAYYSGPSPARGRFGLVAKLNKRGKKKGGKTRKTAETAYDALETSLLGNQIDENPL
jgi:hypothetical protein